MEHTEVPSGTGQPTGQALPPSDGFFAHSVQGLDTDHWQRLDEHLIAVGDWAALFASAFGAQALARAAGLLHDLGKYTVKFQDRLRGSLQSVDHSTWGARIARDRYGSMGYLIAYAIAGHHAGLANGKDAGERSCLADRLDAELPDLLPDWQEEIALPTLQELRLPFRPGPHSDRQQFQMAFLVRMLFSCLVDADFLDTEAFYGKFEKDKPQRRTAHASLQDLRQQLDGHLEDVTASAAPSDVNKTRSQILAHVRAQASLAPGLFSLTVPTGGGKTLASLAFALDHAIAHGKSRVIFVIPFTSIVEQNAAVFRRALGPLGEQAVLEHHSGFTDDKGQSKEARDKLKLAMENWDFPIVVTTAVQFFESLFADRPSKCRKLHNIANSVIVLDEAQTMPLKLLRPCVAALDELASHYRSSVVLCTATQPMLHAPAFEGGLNDVQELAPAPADLFKQLARVQVKHAGELSDDAVTAHMLEHDQALCIVNNRRHARALYEAMAAQPGARHLTTLMCAKHRSEVLAEVRQALKDRQPCRLVSTSLIEAGVDVDFPFVMRAEAGLDSIAQAAGRCNREGRRDQLASLVLVFSVANPDWAPPPELKQYAEAAREVLRQHGADPLSPVAIEAYFRMLYWKKGSQALDEFNLLGLLRANKLDSLPMEMLATKFRMIDSVQMPVIVPYDDEARDALHELSFSEGSVKLARKLQPYLVQVPRRGFEALRSSGAVQYVAQQRWGDQFAELTNINLYDKNFGLSWDNPTFVHACNLVI